MPYQAFQGDAALKSKMVDPVRAKWESGQILPMFYLKWRTDGGVVSISGALAETQNPQEFVDRTGLPLEIGGLCEGILFAGVEFREDASAPGGLVLDGSGAILSFGTEWLDAIRVGDDLSNVTPKFMATFVSRILADDFPMAAHIEAPVRKAAERIHNLWTRELSGETVAMKYWRPVRTSALQTSEESDDPWGYPVAELVESLAWPVRGLATEFVPIFQLFLRSLRDFMTFEHLSDEDRQVQILALIGSRELGRAQRDPALSQEPDEVLLDRIPESKAAMLAFMDPDAKARKGAAQARAQPAIDRVIRQYMNEVIRLIQASGNPDGSYAA